MIVHLVEVTSPSESALNPAMHGKESRTTSAAAKQICGFWVGAIQWWPPGSCGREVFNAVAPRRRGSPAVVIVASGWVRFKLMASGWVRFKLHCFDIGHASTMLTTNAGILAELGISSQRIPTSLSDRATAGFCKSAAILACFPRCDAGTVDTVCKQPGDLGGDHTAYVVLGGDYLIAPP